MGRPRIAQHIALAFGISMNKDLVRRNLAVRSSRGRAPRAADPIAGNGSPRSRRSSRSTWRTALRRPRELRQVMSIVGGPLARMKNLRPLALVAANLLDIIDRELVDKLFDTHAKDLEMLFNLER